MLPVLRQVIWAAIVLALVAGACGGTAAPTPTPSAVKPTGAAAGLLVTSSDLAVGPERFTAAIFDDNQRPIAGAEVRLRFFKLGSEGPAVLRSEVEAPFRVEGLEKEGLQDRGVYAARVTFDAPGAWGVEAVVRRPQRPEETVASRFDVKARSQTPGIGDPAPASRNKTIRDVNSVDELTTARPADPDLYRFSIAQALGDGKPFLVVFATPAFCTSRTCGPEVEIIQALRDKYRERMHFIHIELYSNPVGLLRGGSDRSLRPAVIEWGLPTDPWVFLVDASGRVFDKFEGFTPAAELEESILRMLAGGR